MAKRKLERFAEMKTMAHCLEPTYRDVRSGKLNFKGTWNKDFFKNDYPIVLELGCGKGEYAVGLCEKFHNKNFLGVDIKGARLWRGAKDVEEKNLNNVGFLRTQIDIIDYYFNENEISEIWLTFSDPQKEKPRKRLSGPAFIGRYRKFLKPGGIIHMKTDSELLFDFTLKEIEKNKFNLIESTWNLYGEHFEDLDKDTQEIMEIKTHYEKIFSDKGYDIKYCKFQIN